MKDLTDRTSKYLETLARLIREASVTDAAGKQKTLSDGVAAFATQGHAAHSSGNKLIFIGNGASASMASHYASDFTKNGGIRSLALSDHAMLTALANDIGSDAIFAEQIGFYAQPGDILVAISSSGGSPNIMKAVERARDMNCAVITFSGFAANNPLRLSGDLNFMLPVMSTASWKPLMRRYSRYHRPFSWLGYDGRSQSGAMKRRRSPDAAGQGNALLQARPRGLSIESAVAACRISAQARFRTV